MIIENQRKNIEAYQSLAHLDKFILETLGKFRNTTQSLKMPQFHPVGGSDKNIFNGQNSETVKQKDLYSYRVNDILT